MIKIVTALFMSFACIPAFAADMYFKGSTSTPQFNWTGFYLGAHVGYGWSWAYVFDNGRTDNGTLKGGLAGGQAGYNHQFSNRWVVGAEASVSWAHIVGQRTFTTVVNDGTQDILVLLRGRLGYAFDRALVYGTGGYAFSRVNARQRILATGENTSIYRNHNGYTLGVGAEYALTKNITVRTEYQFVGLETRTYQWEYPPPAINTPFQIRYQSSLIQVGINYLVH